MTEIEIREIAEAVGIINTERHQLEFNLDEVDILVKALHQKFYEKYTKDLMECNKDWESDWEEREQAHKQELEDQAQSWNNKISGSGTKTYSISERNDD